MFTQGGFGKCLLVAPLSLKHTPGNNSFAFRSGFLLPTRLHLGLSAVSTATAAMLPLKINFSIGAVVVGWVRKGWPAFLSELHVFPLLRPLPTHLNPLSASIFDAATLSRPLKLIYVYIFLHAVASLCVLRAMSVLARCCFAM